MTTARRIELSRVAAANLAFAAVLVAGVAGYGFCSFTMDDPGRVLRAVSLPGAIEAVGKALVVVVLAVAAAQALPGPEAWRRLRRRAGVVNLAAGWPLVTVFAVAAWASLPDDLRGCLV